MLPPRSAPDPLHVNLKSFSPPGNLLSLRRIIAAMIIEVRSSGADPVRIANSVAVLAGAFLRATEAGDVQLRLAAIELNYDAEEEQFDEYQRNG